MHISKVKMGAIRCKPSMIGWLFMIMTFLGWVMSVNYNNNLLYLMVFTMLSLMIVSLLLGWLNFLNIDIVGITTHSVFAKDKLHLECNVQNNNFSMAGAIFIDHSSKNSVDKGEIVRGEPLDILVGTTQVLSLETTVHRRGNIALLPIHLASLYPIGLFIFYRPVKSEVNAWVYPEPVGEHLLEDFISQNSFKNGIEADEMKTLRHYQPSDSLSHINWKAYARSDELMTSEYDGGVSSPSMMLDEESLLNLDLESRLSQLAKWVLEAENIEGEYGLKLGEMIIEASKGKTHQQACLMALAKYKVVLNEAGYQERQGQKKPSWFIPTFKVKNKQSNEVKV
ncbi:DUF58 domain-containing protein [Thiomicrorhabdus hydrogeniphila]